MDSVSDHPTERIPVFQRLQLTILGPQKQVVLKEIVTTIDVSENGARVKGQRTLQQNWRGTLLHLSSGRQIPCRVLWQARRSTEGEFWETGLEVVDTFGFWGVRFSNPEPEPPAADIAVEEPIVTPEALLEGLGESPQLQSLEGQRVLEAVWCGLVEQLEERKVFTRAELVASIHKIAQPALRAFKAQAGAG